MCQHSVHVHTARVQGAGNGRLRARQEGERRAGRSRVLCSICSDLTKARKMWLSNLVDVRLPALRRQHNVGVQRLPCPPARGSRVGDVTISGGVRPGRQGVMLHSCERRRVQARQARPKRRRHHHRARDDEDPDPSFHTPSPAHLSVAALFPWHYPWHVRPP